MSDFIDGYDCAIRHMLILMETINKKSELERAIRRQQETVKKIIEEEKNERENHVNSSARA